MPRDIRRGKADIPLTPELLEILAQRLGGEATKELATNGDFGPHSGRVRFDMLHVQVQEYLIRLDPKDLEELRWAVRAGFWVRWTLKGAKFAAWAFSGGLAVAVVAGENLHKLIIQISSAISFFRGSM